MKLLKLGVFLSMLLMTPVLEAQNTSVSLWEENIEQLSMDEEEKNWEDELEELSDRLHEPVNINVTTKHELEQFSTTVQRNYPIGSVDLNRNHSSDVLV